MKLADRMTAQRPPVATPDETEPAATALPSLGDVVARLAAEVSAPLTAALDRVLALARSGRIDRVGLQSLRDEIDGARRAGLRGQQIVRIANGHLQPAHERIDLSRLLRELLTDQAVHATSRAMGNRQTLGRAEVMGDASLVHAVLQAAAEWSAKLARSSVEWRLDLKPWPVRAQVSCRFAHHAADMAVADPAEESPADAKGEHLDDLDTLDWLLLQYSAHRAGVIVQRHDGPSHATLVLEFVHTVTDTIDGAGTFDLERDDPPAPLAAGSQILVLAAKRDARSQVRAAMQGQDLIIDYVPTVAAAAQYVDEGAPQVLLFESAFGGEALRRLCDRLESQSPGVALIEIRPSGNACEMGDAGAERYTRIGADGLRHKLAAVMVLELARRR